LNIRSATGRDAGGIRGLLEQSGLPTNDLAASDPEFVVAFEDEEIIGVGALQRFGTAALVRSVAVASNRRGAGIGRSVVLELEHRASELHIPMLVLLTQTARPFFERLGYREIDRNRAPPDVQTSEEFRSLCPASATCMAKELVYRGFP
jgi:amino-acid N-acetyltransferase